RRRHTRFSRDWSSDVCSSDLIQRDLPSLNEPVIDQANILSPAEKQQLSQRILNLHNAGKGQIGVVIIPTTGQEDIFDYSMRIARSEERRVGKECRAGGWQCA